MVTDEANEQETAVYRQAIQVFSTSILAQLGEAGIEPLINTTHEHVTLLLIGDEDAVPFRVLITIGKKVRQADMREAIEMCRKTPGRAVEVEIP